MLKDRWLAFHKVQEKPGEDFMIIAADLQDDQPKLRIIFELPQSEKYRHHDFLRWHNDGNGMTIVDEEGEDENGKLAQVIISYRFPSLKDLISEVERDGKVKSNKNYIN